MANGSILVMLKCKLLRRSNQCGLPLNFCHYKNTLRYRGTFINFQNLFDTPPSPELIRTPTLIDFQELLTCYIFNSL